MEPVADYSGGRKTGVALTFVRVSGMLGRRVIAAMEWGQPRGTDSVTKVTDTVRSILHPKRTHWVRHRKTPKTGGVDSPTK
jgi:hypothetical protein